VPVAGGLVGDHLSNIQAWECKAGSGLFECDMRCVVGAGEEIRALASRCALAASVVRTDW
jgi:hypothetical protein